MKYLALKKILQSIARRNDSVKNGNSVKALKQAKTEYRNWENLRDSVIVLRGEKTRETGKATIAGCPITIGYPVFYSKRGRIFN